MLFKDQLAILLALVTCVAAQLPPGVHQSGVSRDRYIVEVSSRSALARFGDSQRRSFYNARTKRDVPFEVQNEYNELGVFTGTVIKVQEGEDVSALLDEEDVIAVSPVRSFSVPKLAARAFTGSNNPPTSGVDNSTTHIMTGIDKVRAQGFTGKGIKIAVIDTGINYKHPSLGGGFGPGYKVAGGYDFVGDNYDGTNAPVPDDDPLDTCQGHGTHVAGIIGMNPGNRYDVSGVAPDAELYAYRVLGCSPYTDSAVLIEAILRAYQDGVDIINLSLGILTGFSQDPLSLVANRIAEKGIVVVAGAGNYGANGPWLPLAPAAAKSAIAVGSVDNTVILIQNATVFINGQEGVPVPYYSVTALIDDSTPLEMYATSSNTSVVGDACDPLPDTTPDLSNKVVVIRRGVCPITQKCQNAEKFGAKLFLIYNIDETLESLEFGGRAGAMIRASAGDYLVKGFAEQKNITISFKDRLAAMQDTVNGGLTSTFSSLGPTYEIDLKPEVSAVGGNVVSTWLGDSFAIQQGTSMATPHVAGSAALILQARGKTKITALAMKALLESTASPIASSLTDTTPQTLAWSGTGLIQVDKAINTKTMVTPGHLSLNDSAHFQPIQIFAVTNSGTKPMTYRLSNAPAGTLHTFDSEGQAILPPYTLTKEYATVKFSQTEFTVGPGNSKIIIAEFTAPSIEGSGSYPVYSGRIVITSGSETLTVAYLGVVGSVKDIQLLAHSDPAVPSLPALVNSDGEVQNGTEKYTFAGSDVPAVAVGFNFGTPSFSIELVAANSSDGSNPQVLGTLQNSTDVDRSILGNPYLFPFMGTFTDGTPIPDGEYRAFLKVLRVFGSFNSSQDVETYMSPVFIKDSTNGNATQP